MADCFVVRRGGGGVKPQLIVTAPAGSVITATNGEKNVTGVVGAEGTLTLDLPAFGEWTVTAALDGQEASMSVYIKQEHPVSLSYSTTFTVNGGYGETVTISGEGMTPKTVTLDSTGVGTAVLTGVAGKTLTFTGGTSGYERPVDVGIEGAMIVNVYPDGALFWYGRQFKDVTGGWANNSNLKAASGTQSGVANIGSTINVVSVQQPIASSCAASTVNKINIGNNTVLYAKVDNNVAYNEEGILHYYATLLMHTFSSGLYGDASAKAEYSSAGITTLNIPLDSLDKTSGYYVSVASKNHRGCSAYAIWME